MKIGSSLHRLLSWFHIKPYCTACKKRADEADRRGFIRGSLFLAGLALMAVLPKSLKACCSQVECIFCPCNGHGYWICLECDQNCCTCTITTGQGCIFLTEYCNNCLAQITYGACCNPCISQTSVNTTDQGLPDRWELRLEDGGTIIFKSRGEFDPMEKAENGKIRISDAKYNPVKVISAKKL